jgi:hypothetical protein
MVVPPYGKVMTDEKKDVAPEVTEEAQASETPTEESSTEAVVETGSEETSADIDYQAELEKELKLKEKRLGQAEFKIQQLKKDAKTSKEIEDDYTDAQQLSAEEVRQIIREENTVFYAKTRENEVKARINQNSTSPQEADLIFYHLQNSIQITGDDEKDIATAKLLANARRYQSDLKERDRLIRSNANANVAGGSSQRVNNSEGSVRLTDQEQKLANKMDPDGSKKLAEKMLEAKKAESIS